MMEKELPEGWELTNIETVTDRIHYGYTASSTFEDTGTKFLRITDIQDDRVDWNIVPYCDISERDREKYLLKTGDLVFARTGATVGKSFLIDEVPEAIFASYLIRVIINKNIDKNFLYYFFKSGDYWQQIIDGSRGIGQPNVNAQVLSQISFPLPPLAEQKRIVAKLDMAFGYLETLKASLVRIPVFLKTFRQSVLTQAVTGKLTEDWRVGKEFDVEKEIDAIKKERCQIFSTRKKILFEECGDKSSINSWAKIYIEEIFDVQTGSTPKRDIDRYWDEGDIPWIKSGQVSNKDITEADEFITESAVTETNAKLYPINSILIAMYGEGKTRGQVGILKFKATSNQAIAAMVNPHLNDFTIKYVFLFGLSQYAEIRKEAAGGNQPNLNTGKIKKWKIDFPPLKEQEEIVKRVEALFAKSDAIEAQCLSLKGKIDKLPQALLAKAFRGELVPQDPANEPAAVLLEKIQKEMGKLGKKEKKQMELVFEK